jgi:hypothetical protein
MEKLLISLTLCLASPPPAAVDGVEPRACYELAIFDSREECAINARIIKVEVKGRLLCQPRDLSPDERRALHALGLVRR